MSRQRSMETIAHAEYVTIGELVRLTDVRYSTLKFYTEQGLLPFEQAEENLTRRYCRTRSIERIRLLRSLRAQGRTIAEVKAIVSALERPGGQTLPDAGQQLRRGWKDEDGGSGRTCPCCGFYFDAALTRINRGGQVDGGKTGWKRVRLGFPSTERRRRAGVGKIIFCSQSGPCRRAFEEERQQSGARHPEAAGRRAPLCAVRRQSPFCEKHAVKIAAQRMRLYTHRAKLWVSSQ